MNELFVLGQNVIELGLIYSLVVLSMHLTSRIIKFDDLTVTGSFGIGGAISAQLLVMGVNPIIKFPVVIASGCFLGLCTGLLHTKLNMNNLISGIVISTAAFSINLKIAGPNIALGPVMTLFEIIPFQILEDYRHLIILSVLIITAFALVKWFLQTQMGFMLKAVGDNPQMLTNLGKSIYSDSSLSVINI